MAKISYTTIDEYIAGCPARVQPMLHKLRSTIAEAAPLAGEKISWGMATFTLHGNLVHFSAETKHIGFHPAPSAIEEFSQELKPYNCSKGTVQLPYSRELPLDLIRRMVIFRVKEQEQLAVQKELGIKAPAKELRPRFETPDYMAEALNSEGLQQTYEARPPYQRNDYIAWITSAKQAATREKRLQQMLNELESGNIYMGRPYKAGNSQN